MPTKEFANNTIKAVIDGPIKKSVNSVFDGINRGVESLDLYGKYSKAQRLQIKNQLENVKLLGMPSPIKLETIYYPTQILTTIRRRLYEQEWLKQDDPINNKPYSKKTGAKNAPISADEYVEKNKKIVVLGGPGAGKTTFLKFLSLLHASAIDLPHKKTQKELVPFFVQLPHFAKSNQELLDYICESLTKASDEYARDYVCRVFEKDHAILLLDSLDEVPISQRKTVTEQIKIFETRFTNARIVLSCRIADYEETLDNFCEVEIARLNKDAIKKIVYAWFNDDSIKAKKLLGLIQNDDGVATLTETPLLLSLLCIQYRHDLALPKRKSELYRRCVDTLLRDWDTSRGFRRESAYENISDDRKERLFEHISGKFFIELESYELRKDLLIDTVSSFLSKIDLDSSIAAGLIQEIERHHGILEQFSQDSYCFSHTSLQEYFVARHILSRRIEQELVTANIDNENWHPIIEFIVALAENPTPILKTIIKKSEISGLSNFPPMARRTKLLMLLYKCLLSSPFTERETLLLCHKHLVESQISMSHIFISGNVIPIAELSPSGVRHILLHTSRPRPTLGDALQPYRKFTNQILSAPINSYAEACFQGVDNRLEEFTSSLNGVHGYANTALLINLLMPLGISHPNEVLDRLDLIFKNTTGAFFKNISSNSYDYIKTLIK